jgi:hypothetical protein
MTRFAKWCTEVVVGCSAPHSQTMLTADASKFDAAVAIVANVVPEHFLPSSRLADMFVRLQRHKVAELIQNRLPESAQLKSGDLGEVLCTTFVREKTPFTLGIKRLQFKDHRNMSMRGDDMLGFNFNSVTGKLAILKAESKSRATMTAGTISNAREALSGYGELPSPHSMGFVADRLLDPADKFLRDAIDDAQLNKSIKPTDVTHMLFAFAGNDTTTLLQTNLSGYTGAVTQHYVGLLVPEHQKFIKAVFAAVGA